jgi:hypothetical protein
MKSHASSKSFDGGGRRALTPERVLHAEYEYSRSSGRGLKPPKPDANPKPPMPAPLPA